jgi:membrane-bound inhibitor of C-type lysozyme
MFCLINLFLTSQIPDPAKNSKKYKCEHCRLQVKTLNIDDEIVLGKSLLNRSLSQFDTDSKPSES